ncbi:MULTISPECIES: glycosyltransferase family protein [Peptostreptococcaceae]|uniref:glycosyltransferase family protein n=1 Tax=Peptostreptococcaceae TaxID=186804 RepID=UPI003F2C9A55
MDEKKICFISAVNDDIQYYQCLLYINALNVPEGFEIEALPVRNAKSMCEAYNKAMNLSDAKYKIYLHQDANIINQNFIQDVLNIFEKNQSIGIIGVCGAKNLPENKVWWESSNTVGKLYEKNGTFYSLLKFKDVEGEYEEVEAVDGFIMITQYDIAWREDIFDNWHFYDISQSQEFIKKGYKTIVVNQSSPWCMHTRGNTDMNIYEKYRQMFISTYKE